MKPPVAKWSGLGVFPPARPALSGSEVLSLAATALELARAFVIPPKVVEDAFHAAVATLHGMDFLLTWNCRHPTNSEIMGRPEGVCAELGYLMPVFCTPEQSMGDW